MGIIGRPSDATARHLLLQNRLRSSSPRAGVARALAVPVLVQIRDGFAHERALPGAGLPVVQAFTLGSPLRDREMEARAERVHERLVEVAQLGELGVGF